MEKHKVKYNMKPSKEVDLPDLGDLSIIDETNQRASLRDISNLVKVKKQIISQT